MFFCSFSLLLEQVKPSMSSESSNNLSELLLGYILEILMAATDMTNTKLEHLRKYTWICAPLDISLHKFYRIFFITFLFVQE